MGGPVLGSDPGLTRLRMARQAVVTIVAGTAAEWLFVHLAHAPQTDIRPGCVPRGRPGRAQPWPAGHRDHARRGVFGMIARFASCMFPAREPS